MNPWDRRGNESEPAWEAFTIYRDMGNERTQDAVGEKLAKSRQLISRWSAEHAWVDRTAAWDSHVDQERQQAFIKGQTRAVDDLMQLAGALQRKAHAYFLALDETDMRTTDAIRMAEAAAKIVATAAAITEKTTRTDTGDTDKTVDVVELVKTLLTVNRANNQP